MPDRETFAVSSPDFTVPLPTDSSREIESTLVENFFFKAVIISSVIRSSSSSEIWRLDAPNFIPLLLVSSSSDCFFRPTVMLFAPICANSSVIDVVSEELTVIIAITEPIPIIIPSIVRRERILFPNRPLRASFTFSQINMQALLFVPRLSHHPLE